MVSHPIGGDDLRAGDFPSHATRADASMSALDKLVERAGGISISSGVANPLRGAAAAMSHRQGERIPAPDRRTALSMSMDVAKLASEAEAKIRGLETRLRGYTLERGVEDGPSHVGDLGYLDQIKHEALGAEGSLKFILDTIDRIAEAL